MNLHKPNRVTQKVQQLLDQRTVPSQVEPKAPWNHGDANTWAGAVEAFQGFMRMLDGMLSRHGGEDRRRLAMMLIPWVTRLLARLEKSCGAKSGTTARSSCDSCSKEQDCKAPCEHLKDSLDSVHEGKLHGEMTDGVELDGIRALRGSSQDVDSDEESRRTSRPGPALQALTHDEAVYALFVNGKGRRATESEVQSLRPEDYTVYLDATRDMLGIHLPGSQPSCRSIQEAGINGVQDILGVMIEHPHLNIGNVNIGSFLPHRAGMTPDAFRKAMANLRYALQQGKRDGPLLLHVERSHYSISESGHAWRISNSQGDLCFVRFLLPSERFRPKRRSRAGAKTNV